MKVRLADLPSGHVFRQVKTGLVFEKEEVPDYWCLSDNTWHRRETISSDEMVDVFCFPSAPSLAEALAMDTLVGDEGAGRVLLDLLQEEDMIDQRVKWEIAGLRAYLDEHRSALRTLLEFVEQTTGADLARAEEMVPQLAEALRLSRRIK